MAKEGELKKMELKVSVNCCEGCKRKVKKALRSVEGVLRIDIDQAKPKVTVLGNVDPIRLIKKLCKAGKHAELLSLSLEPLQEQPKEGSNSKREPPKASSFDELSSREDEMKISKTGEAPKRDAGSNPLSASAADGYDDAVPHDRVVTQPGEVRKSRVTPAMIHLGSEYQKVVNYPHSIIRPGELYQAEVVHVTSYDQYPCVMEPPRTVAIPVYSMSSFMVPPPPPYVEEQHGFARPALSHQGQTTSIGDYFSDDNSIGCTVM